MTYINKYIMWISRLVIFCLSKQAKYNLCIIQEERSTPGSLASLDDGGCLPGRGIPNDLWANILISVIEPFNLLMSAI